MRDIFSRYVVGWLLARPEVAALAKVLITERCQRHPVPEGRLVIHADRGPSMTCQPVALLLAPLGVLPFHSRPHVSDDTPFSEAQFKTLTYRPSFPARFGALEDAEGFRPRFFPWDKAERRHVALGLMAPPAPAAAPAVTVSDGVESRARLTRFRCRLSHSA